MAKPLTSPGAPAAGNSLDEVVNAVRAVAEVRRRAALAAARLDRVSGAMIGLGYAAVAVAVAVAGADPADLAGPVPARIAALVALYVLAYRTEFVSASGSAVPTQPVLVALLLTTPLPLVPLAVLAGQQLGALGSPRSGSLLNTLVVRAVPGWHCLGPVTVLGLAGHGDPSLALWPVYVAALGYQFAVDAVVALVRSTCLGVAARDLVRPVGWTFAVDTLLAGLGLAVVVAAGTAPGSGADLVLLAAPILLVRLLAADRVRNLAAAVTLEGALSEVSEQARHDALTGLANRRAWDEALAGAERGATVLVADLDGLKAVNDTQGHDAGDTLIRAMAGVLRESAPEEATVARLGGDEYGVLLATTDPAAGPALAERIRRGTAGHPGVAGSPLSASLGWAVCPAGGDVAEAARVADARAGQDKAARRVGRRRDDVPPSPDAARAVGPVVSPRRSGARRTGQAPDAATSSASRSIVRTEAPVPPTGV